MHRHKWLEHSLGEAEGSWTSFEGGNWNKGE